MNLGTEPSAGSAPVARMPDEYGPPMMIETPARVHLMREAISGHQWQSDRTW